MRNVAVGSVVAVMLLTGVFVSQVEAKSDKYDDQGKNKRGYSFFENKNNKWVNKGKHEYKFEVRNHKQHNNNNRSVPIPGTALLLGGGFAGLVAWRARRRQPGA